MWRKYDIIFNSETDQAQRETGKYQQFDEERAKKEFFGWIDDAYFNTHVFASVMKGNDEFSLVAEEIVKKYSKISRFRSPKLDEEFDEFVMEKLSPMNEVGPCYVNLEMLTTKYRREFNRKMRHITPPYALSGLIFGAALTPLTPHPIEVMTGMTAFLGAVGAGVESYGRGAYKDAVNDLPQRAKENEQFLRDCYEARQKGGCISYSADSDIVVLNHHLYISWINWWKHHKICVSRRLTP